MNAFGIASPLPMTGFQPRQLRFAPPAWRPARPPSPAGTPAAQLGQAGVAKGAAIGAVLIYGAIGAAAAYVGFSYGAEQKGFKSILGYAVGIGGGIRAALSVLGALGIALIPTNEV